MSDGDTYTAPEHGWTCFHCGEHFEGTTRAGQKAAEQHFGWTPDHKAACLIKGSKDHGLLWRLRAAERALATLKSRVLDEDTDKDRQIAAMQCAHSRALMEAEETGYSRGLRDARAELHDPATEAILDDLAAFSAEDAAQL